MSPRRILKFLPLSKSLIASACLAAPVAAYSAPTPTGTDQLIVKFDEAFVIGSSEANRLSEATGKSLRFVRQTAGGRLLFQLNENQSYKAMRGLSRAIERLAGVSYAEPDIHMATLGLPNDPLLPNYQWHYYGPDSSSAEPGGLNAVQAWEALDSSYTKTVVAILDTGSTNHSDLSINTIAGYDMISDPTNANDGDGRDSDPSDPGDNLDPNDPYGSSWHGTHVAGTVGADTNNGNGVAGVGFDRVQLMHVRVLGVGGGSYSDITDAIYWASQNGAKVINMSLGGASSCSPNSALQAAINSAVANGVSVVVSAGNSDTDTAGFTPASCSNVMNVAAVNRNGGKASYSNYGSLVDFAAPGGDGSNSIGTYVVSTHNKGTTSPGEETYSGMAGTSMAAPHVAGLVALISSENSSLTPAEIEQLIKDNARPFPATCDGCGAGIADAHLAMQAASGGTITDPEPTLQAPDAPSLLTTSVQSDGSVILTWFDVADEQKYELQVSQKARGKRWGSYGDVNMNIAADSTTLTDVPGNGTFKYRIRAANSAGSSAWTESGEVRVESNSDDGDGGSGKTKCNPKKGC
ncbi:S8 family serine peptidase [Motiliproteus coralliicola]|nr:S8 family serine peptidase [Motiliproteus coralliicola]